MSNGTTHRIASLDAILVQSIQDGLMDHPTRRLTLRDLGALVAASALAMAPMGWLYPDIRWSMIPKIWTNKLARSGGLLAIAEVLTEAVVLLMPAVLIYCAVLMGLRLQHPRPRPWRRLWSLPGNLACLMITIPTLMAFGLPLLGRRMRGEPIGRPPWSHMTTDWPVVLAGTAVIVAWLTLCLTGRWRPERSWIDRAGRALGSAVAAAAGLIGVRRVFG